MTRSITSWLGFSAIAFSLLYFASDVVEAAQGGFSTVQLAMTYVAEAAIPFLVIGLFAAQRPQIGVLGLIGALAYAYSYIFFTSTVVYALVNNTPDFNTLSDEMGAWLLIHGAIMVLAGLAFGRAVIRARILPVWTGATLMVGVVVVAAASGTIEPLETAAAGIRGFAFVAMGLALVARTGREPYVAI